MTLFGFANLKFPNKFAFAVNGMELLDSRSASREEQHMGWMAAAVLPLIRV
jgi:hypothetical protein